jgi:hypothetical protein
MPIFDLYDEYNWVHWPHQPTKAGLVVELWHIEGRWLARVVLEPEIAYNLSETTGSSQMWWWSDDLERWTGKNPWKSGHVPLLRRMQDGIISRTVRTD